MKNNLEVITNLINDNKDISLGNLESHLKTFFHKSDFRNGNNFFIGSRYIEFLSEFFGIDSHKTALVLSPDMGFFSRYLIEKNKVDVVTCVSMIGDVSELNKKISSSSNVITDNPLSYLESKNIPLQNLIFSFPPLGYKHPNSNYPKIFDYEHQLLIESSKHLETNGQAIFVMSPRLVSDPRLFKEVCSELESTDSSLKAIITLPNGFYPYTTISPLLIVIEKKSNEKVFIAKYPDDKLLKSVIKNYKQNTSSRFVEQGQWLAIDKVRGLSNLKATEALALIKTRTGLTEYFLDDLADIEKCKPKLSYNQPTNNIFYSHLITTASNKRAIKSIDSTGSSVQNYVQVKIKSNKVIEDYLMLYFQKSPYYVLALNEYARGTAIQSINTKDFLKLRIFLPSIDVQKSVVESNKKVDNLKSQLDILGDSLWERESKIKDSILDINKQFPGKKFDSWIEGLHFPLATILWNYYTAETDSLKTDRLLMFFEALAEYLAIIQLSAYQQNPTLCSDVIDNVFETLNKAKLNLERATFGTWNTLYESLAKKTRAMVNGGSDDKEWIYEVFKTHNSKLIEYLVDKKFITILKGVVNIRNTYKGHSGETSDEQTKDTLYDLETYLFELEPSLEYICDNYSLVKAISSKKQKGAWLNVCEKIHGTRHEFQKMEIINSNGIDSDCLSLLNNQTNEVIELNSLVQIKQGPKTDVPACYFYNRTESDGKTRFVSYHFGNDSETKFIDLGVNQILKNDVC